MGTAIAIPIAIGVENNMVERERITRGVLFLNSSFHVIAYRFGAFGLLKRDFLPKQLKKKPLDWWGGGRGGRKEGPLKSPTSPTINKQQQRHRERESCRQTQQAHINKPIWVSHSEPHIKMLILSVNWKKKNQPAKREEKKQNKTKQKALTLRNQLEPNLTRKPTTARVGP